MDEFIFYAWEAVKALLWQIPWIVGIFRELIAFWRYTTAKLILFTFLLTFVAFTHFNTPAIIPARAVLIPHALGGIAWILYYHSNVFPRYSPPLRYFMATCFAIFVGAFLAKLT